MGIMGIADKPGSGFIDDLNMPYVWYFRHKLYHKYTFYIHTEQDVKTDSYGSL